MCVIHMSACARVYTCVCAHACMLAGVKSRNEVAGRDSLRKHWTEFPGRLCGFTAESPGSIPGRGTRDP